MTISRGQTPRQLYGLGSFIKKITKPVKKVVSKVKDFAKSDLGKFGLLALGSGIPFGGGKFFGPGSLFGKVAGNPFVSGILDSKVARKIGDVALDVGVGSLIAGGIDRFTRPKLDPSQQRVMGRTGEEIAEVERELRQNYKNLGYTEGEIDLLVEQNMREYRAMGGRIGYSEGKNMLMASAPDPVDSLNDMAQMLFGRNVDELTDDEYIELLDAARDGASEGGRMGYAMGDTAEDNAIQASGIMGLPLNENPAGVTELDLRNTGGFIPPVGVKEKADDIPAMLSNNEFVFTADAVRGMGDGDVNKGAERMYSMMKQLENGGRV